MNRRHRYESVIGIDMLIILYSSNGLTLLPDAASYDKIETVLYRINLVIVNGHSLICVFV